MTGKLVKYEIKSSIRIMGILWAALVASAILLGFFMGTLNDLLVSSEYSSLNLMGTLLEVILPVLYGGLFMAVVIVTVLVIIIRFYRGLLSDEGYLMHTLPVKPWQLITSKGIVATGIVTVSIIAAVVSLLIFVSFGDFREVLNGLRDIGSYLGENPKYILVIVEGIIVFVFGIVKSVYQIYASMAIGQLAAKYRALVSLGAYMAISAVISILGVILITIADSTGFDVTLARLIDSLDVFTSPFAIIQGAIGIMFLLTAVQFVAFHIATERIMTKKLNLI